jgi:hypothetical protein
MCNFIDAGDKRPEHVSRFGHHLSARFVAIRLHEPAFQVRWKSGSLRTFRCILPANSPITTVQIAPLINWQLNNLVISNCRQNNFQLHVLNSWSQNYLMTASVERFLNLALFNIHWCWDLIPQKALGKMQGNTLIPKLTNIII